MGAWATGPFDNDIACDWMVELENRWLQQLEGHQTSRDFYLYDEIRAMAEVIVSVGKQYRFSEATTQSITLFLNRMLKDREWLETWVDEDSIKKSIRRQIKQIKGKDGK